MITVADKNGSGKVNMEEFLSIMLMDYQLFLAHRLSSINHQYDVAGYKLN